MSKIKLLCSLFFCLIVQSVFADDVTTIVPTDDKVTISALTVEPGSDETYSFTVSLEGSAATEHYYTAYDVFLTFPEGLDVALTSKGAYRVSMVKPSLYPYSVEEEENEEGEIIEVKSYTHTLSCNFISDRCLRVLTYSNSNEEFTKHSGSLFKVYVKASPYLKPGSVPVKVHTVVLSENRPDSDGGYTVISHCPEDYVNTSIEAEPQSTLALKVSATNKFGTCILPFDAELPADGSLEAYTSTKYTDEVLLLTKAEKMEAFTPYILYAPEGYEVTLSGAVDASKYPAEGYVVAGNLVGTLVQTEITAGSYVMQNQGNGAMFYRVGDTPFSVGAGKCYVALPEGVEVASAAMRFDHDTTGIDSVSPSSADDTSTKYNIMGQRILHPVPGQIYIQGGQKYIER